MRIVTGGEMPKDKYDALLNSEALDEKVAGLGSHLNFQMTVEQNVAVRYTIGRPFDFLIRMVGDSVEEKLAYVEKQMADTIVAVLRREYTKYPVGGVIATLQKTENLVTAELGRVTESWGISVVQVSLKSPDLTHKLNEALRDIPQASAEAEAAAKRGTGRGLEKGNEIREVAAANKAAAADIGTDPLNLLILERAGDIVKPGDKVILGAGGITEALGLGASVIAGVAKAFSAKAPTPVAGEGEAP
jgi:hypothetical protein